MINVVVIPVTPFQQNCSLLCCEKSGKAALVDPGGDIELLLEAVDENKVTVEKILVTHAHIDHAGAVAELSEKLSVPIEGPHREDQFWIDMLEEQASTFGFPQAKAFEPQRWLEQGDRVSVGELELEVYHCPGHTPGHVVFYHRGSNLAIVGDVLFKGSIGRTDFPRGEHATLIRSIKENLWPLGNDVQFIPGHGPMSSFGEERNNNPFVGDNAV